MAEWAIEAMNVSLDRSPLTDSLPKKQKSPAPLIAAPDLSPPRDSLRPAVKPRPCESPASQAQREVYSARDRQALLANFAG